MIGIEGGTFSGLNNLREVNFDPNDNFKYIGDDVFAWLKELERISFPDKIYEIGERAFQGCDNLYFNSLPSSLKKIGDMAFAECYELKDFTFNSEQSSTFEYVKTVDDSGKTTGGYLTTKNDKNNHQFSCVGDIAWGKIDITSDLSLELLNGKHLLLDSVTSLKFLNTLNGPSWPELLSHSLKYLQLPSGLTEIAEQFLPASYELETLILPNTITTIGAHALSASDVLHTLNIPSQILNINDWGISLDPNGGIAYFQNTDLSYIENLNFNSEAFYHKDSTKYRYVTPVVDSLDNTTKLLNKYKEKLGDNIEENDIIIPHWDDILLSESVITDLNDDSFNNPDGTWKLDNSIYWKSNNFSDTIQPSQREYNLELIDQQNNPINLPDWLNFDAKLGQITLKDGISQHEALNLNNIHIKLQDVIFGYTHTSTKSFSINLSAVNPTPTPEEHSNIWAPLMGGIFGGIVFSGLTTGTILVIKNKRNKDKNK